MGTKTSIEWTRGEDGTAGATWTPIRARNIKTGKRGWHCEHVTTGCEFCYAESMNRRLGTGLPFKPGHRKDVELFLDEKMLVAPLGWRQPKKVFVCSMTDLFASFVPDEWIVRILDIIRRTSHDGGSNCGKISGEHTYQILTKRADRMAAFMPRLRFDRNTKLGDVGLYLSDDGKPSVVMKNIWLGVSAERQQEWDERKGHLAATPAAIRFASFEPLLGPIVEPCSMSDFIQWAIVGSESGRNARPCDIEWVRGLRNQCSTASVPFFWKQHAENGRKIPVPKLDGRQWMEFPVGA